MKILLQIVFACGWLLFVACSTTTRHMPRADRKLDSNGPHKMLAMSSPGSEVPPSASRAQPKDMFKAANPEFQGESGDRRDEATNMERLTVRAQPLTSYCLVHDNYHKTLKLIDYRGAPLEAIAAGKGIIWAEAGYWDSQIVAIDSVEVSTLGRREWYRMLFYGPDPVRLTVVAHSKRIVVIDAYTGKGPKPNKAPEPTPGPVTPRATEEASK